MIVLHWLAVFVGVRNDSWATWWGGFGADLPEFAIFLVLYRKFVCHADTCRRLGVHRVVGTPFTTCRKHHPHGGNSAEAILDAHRHATVLRAAALASATAASTEPST
jgi:hypothetical protein